VDFNDVQEETDAVITVDDIVVWEGLCVESVELLEEDGSEWWSS
jgi:hypothetical protein